MVGWLGVFAHYFGISGSQHPHVLNKHAPVCNPSFSRNPPKIAPAKPYRWFSEQLNRGRQKAKCMITRHKKIGTSGVCKDYFFGVESINLYLFYF